MKAYQQLLSKQINGYHFYDAMGGARYDASETDAAIENLIPSVTTVIGIKKNHGVEQSRVNNAITTTFRLASEGKLGDLRNDGNEDSSVATEAIKERVVNAMSERGFEAAEFGRSFHDYLNSYAEAFRDNDNAPCEGPKVADEHRDQWNLLKDWFDTEIIRVHETEASVVDLKSKTAGTLDLLCDTKSNGTSLVDLKSQKAYIRKDGSPSLNYYDDWAIQLAKYQDGVVSEPTTESTLGVKMKDTAAISLVISSDKPIYPVAHKWDSFELNQGRKKFDLMQGLWEMDHFVVELDTDQIESMQRRSKRVGGKSMKSLKEQCLGLVAKDLHKKTFNDKSYLGKNHTLEEVENVVRLCHGYSIDDAAELPFAREDLKIEDDPRENFSNAMKLLLDQEEASLFDQYPSKTDPSMMNGTGKRRLESLMKRAREARHKHDNLCTEMGIPISPPSTNFDAKDLGTELPEAPQETLKEPKINF